MRLFGTDFQTLCFFMSFSKHMLSMNLTFWALETQMNFSTDFRERPFRQSRFSLHWQLILSILPCHFSQIIYKYLDLPFQSGIAFSIWTCLFNPDLPFQSRLVFSIWICLFNLDLPFQSRLVFSIRTCLFNPDLNCQMSIWTCIVNLDLLCQFGLAFSIQTCIVNPD